MIRLSFWGALLVILLFLTPQAHSVNMSVILELDQELMKAENPTQKSRLHMYKARHFAKAGLYEDALKCYNTALRLNPKGWVHLERARFFINFKKYDRAESEAAAAMDETATLASQALPIMKKAKKEQEKKYLAEHPPTILLDRRADAARKSRFDYIKPTGNVAVSEYSKELTKSRQEARKAAASSSKKRVRRS